MEHKTFLTLEHKVVDDVKGIVEHFVAITGNRDLGNDRIISGAFRKTIVERGLLTKVLDQHRTDSIQAVIGMPLAMQEVGKDQLPPQVLDKFPDATGGLKVTTQYLMDTPEGRGAFLRIKSGAVSEYSIGYDAVKGGTSYTKSADGVSERQLKEIKLWEYSPVIFGMNPATTTLSAKEADPGDADEGEESEPDAEPEIKAGRTISRATTAQLKAAVDALNVLIATGEAYDAEEDDEEPKEMKSAPGGVPQAADNEQAAQAGPVIQPPTSKLLKLIEIELSELHH